MKVVLVLSGGGAKGRFQVGALTRLAELGVTYDAVAGVSVGSLNGALIAQGELDKLINIWENITTPDIYRKYSYASMAWRLCVEKKRSIYNAEPLRALIAEHVVLDKVRVPYYLGLTSLVSGKYHGLAHTEFPTNKDFGDGVYASALMPILWEPINVQTNTELIIDAVDGGLRNISPLSDIIKESPDKIIIINCNRMASEEEKQKSIVNVAVRTFIDIILNEVIVNDVKELININDLVKQARWDGYVLRHPLTGRVYKEFEVEFYEPEGKIGSPIIFEPNVTQLGFDMGYRAIGR